MDFIKKNGLLAGMVAGFLVFLGVGGFMLKSKISERETVAEDLRAKKDEYANLMAKKPTPDVKNVDAATKYEETLSAGLRDPLAKLKQSFLSFDPIKENECKQKIIDARDRMDQMMERNVIMVGARAVGSGASVAFHYGFDRYATAIPKVEDTPMIQKQLKIVEELMKYAAEARVAQVIQVNRVEFEKDAAPAGTRPARGAAHRAPSSGPKQRVPLTEPLISVGEDFVYVSQPGYLYSTMPFELEIKCTSEALRDFLNKLAQSPLVFLPRIIVIENEKKDGLRESVGGAGQRNSSNGGHDSGGRGNRDPGLILPDQHEKVFGYELIKVGMRIEWLEFYPEEISGKSEQKKK